jgi:hypothetical protein
MAIYATDVVSPVFTATEVVVLFLARVTAKTRLRRDFRRFVFERNDLRWITFFNVRLTWTMTRLATRYLLFPTTDLSELSM